MSELYWQWIFGGVLVLIYAVKRFNTPPSNRLSTTTERYYFSLLLYLLALWLLFLLVGGTLANSPELVKIFFGVDINETAEKLSGPLYSALLMTTLLPNTRLSKFDQWLREASWDIGNIPIAARRLGSQLRRSRLSVPVVFQDAVKERLAGFDEDDIVFEPNGSEQHKWTRITALTVIIKDWKEQDIPKRDCQFSPKQNWTEDQIEEWQNYDKIPLKLVEDYSKIQKDFNWLRPKAHAYFTMVREYGADNAAVQEYASGIMEMVHDLHRAATHFIARGVLRLGDTDTDRVERLEHLGFVNVSSIQKPGLSADQIVGVGLGTFLILMSCLVGAKYISSLVKIPQIHDGINTIGRITFTASMVGVIYGFAVAAAIYPKTLWRSFDRRRRHSRPLLAYLASGFFAVILAGMVALTFRFLYCGDFVEAVRSFYWDKPWYVLCFVTGFTISCLADNWVTEDSRINHKLRRLLRRLLPWLESLSFAGILVLVVGAVVHPWLEQIGNPSSNPQWVGANGPPDWFHVPPRPVLLVTCGLIGALLGHVPYWYRKSLRKGAEDAENKPDWEIAGDDFARIPIRIDTQMGKGAGELASVTIENIPHGAVLTAGTEAHGSPEEVPIKDGAGIVVPNQITSLALTLASNSLDDLALRMLKKIRYSYPDTGNVAEKVLAPVYLKLERGVFAEVGETGG
jgi:hypothetical protein